MLKAIIVRATLVRKILKITSNTSNENIFGLADFFLKQASNEKLEEASKILAENYPKLNDLYNHGNPDPKYYLTPYNLQELIKLPENTLGHIYAKNMLSAGFDTEFFTRADIDNLAKFVVIRMRKTHDIWHAVTGFGTDPIGEVGLQGFYASQSYSQFPISILIAGLFSILENFSLNYSKTMLDAIFTGYSMGKNAESLLTETWEDDWETDIEDIRKRLKISVFDTQYDKSLGFDKELILEE